MSNLHQLAKEYWNYCRIPRGYGSSNAAPPRQSVKRPRLRHHRSQQSGMNRFFSGLLRA